MSSRPIRGPSRAPRCAPTTVLGSASSDDNDWAYRGALAMHLCRTSSRLRASTRAQVLAQKLYEYLQRLWHLSPARIIQKECGHADPPVLQQGNQPARFDLRRGIAESRIQHAHAVHRGSDGQFRVVDG